MRITSRQSLAASHEKPLGRNIRSSLTALSFVAFTFFATSPAECFAQTTEHNVHGERTATVSAHQNAGPHRDLVPTSPNNPPDDGGGVPPSGGGSGSGSNTSATITYFDRNTTAHTAQLQLSNGAHVTVDTDANKVYVTYAGKTKSFSLDEVLKKEANGSASIAAQRKAELISKLSAPVGNARFQSLSGRASQTNLRSPSKLLMPPNSTYAQVHPTLMKEPGSGGYIRPFECSFYFACDYREVYYDDIGGGGYGFWYFDTNTPSSSHGQDWYYWNRWRRDHCSNAKSEWGTSYIAGAALGAELAAPVVGWLAAAVTAVGAIYEGIQATQDERICNSSYPGQGKW